MEKDLGNRLRDERESSSGLSLRTTAAPILGAFRPARFAAAWQQVPMITVTVTILTVLFAIGAVSPLLVTGDTAEVVKLDQTTAPEE